jgi:hypothetical protein
MFRLFRNILANIANLANEPSSNTPFQRDVYYQSDVEHNLSRWFGGKKIERRTSISQS